jgi:hypothetical protein
MSPFHASSMRKYTVLLTTTRCSKCTAAFWDFVEVISEVTFVSDGHNVRFFEVLGTPYDQIHRLPSFRPPGICS